MNPIIGILLIGFITLMLFVAPYVLFYGGWAVIALILLAITALVVVFWWKVITDWIKQL